MAFTTLCSVEQISYVVGSATRFVTTVLPSIIFPFDRLPPQTEDYDPEEDEPVLEVSWPHLQVVYEFFLRFIVSSEVNAKVAKRYVDPSFCFSLIELFDSEGLNRVTPRDAPLLQTDVVN